MIPPVCTPLTAEYEVDIASLERLVDFLIDGGADALFFLGSTSEVAFLTDAQRRTVLDAGLAHVAGRVPVIAGVIDMTTPRVLAQAGSALAAGAAGLVATAPFYTRTHVAEIERHYRLIKAGIGEIPLYAYDIPVAVGGVKLDAEMLLRLAADGVLAGLKDSSGNDGALRQVLIGRRIAAAQGFSVLTGSELTVDNAMAMGADGVVPGLGNVDPAGYSALIRYCRAGDRERAREEQDRLVELFGLIGAGAPERMGRGSSAVGAFKAALQLRGVIASATTAPPAIPLNEAEIGQVRRHLAAAGLL
ncbi:MAG TPA: dihydrodipicolinate synthase family protein [Mycobacteriales bacterium]|nr:dihydrodipicolinate synthase family protein [Mycobacteriales bacterium]